MTKYINFGIAVLAVIGLCLRRCGGQEDPRRFSSCGLRGCFHLPPLRLPSQTAPATQTNRSLTIKKRVDEVNVPFYHRY